MGGERPTYNLLVMIDLIGANLSGVDLSSANLNNAVLIGADLNGTDLSVVDLSGAIITMESSIVANAEQLALLKAGVEGWNAWRQANTDAELDVAIDLSGADLNRADLSYADPD